MLQKNETSQMRTGVQQMEGIQTTKAILGDSFKKKMGKQSNAWPVY